MGANESFQSNLWKSTFELQSKNNRLGIIRLTDKQTEDSYICRKLSVLDKKEMQEIERLIDIKLSVQSPYLVKLQKATSHNHQQSCAYGKTYYLLFKHPYQTLKQQTLSRKFKNSLYSQQQLQIMLEVGIKSLFFLKNINHPHENISSSAFFINENRSMILGDPFMFPRQKHEVKVKNGFVYPSPEVIKYQNHEIEYYDKNLSDLFTFAIVLLQVFYMLNMDSIYENHFQRVNYEVIHQKLSLINNLELRKKLFILVDPQPRNRQLIFKYYIKSNNRIEDEFGKLERGKFKKTIERYNLAMSEVTEWKNDEVVGKGLVGSEAEGKKTISVSTNYNQNTPIIVNKYNKSIRIASQHPRPQKPLSSSLRQQVIHDKNIITYDSIRQITTNQHHQSLSKNISINNINSPISVNHPHSYSNYIPQQQQQYNYELHDESVQRQIHSVSVGRNPNSVQRTYSSYQMNNSCRVPTQSLSTTQTYPKDYITQYYHTIDNFNQTFSNYNLYTRTPFQDKHRQFISSISPREQFIPNWMNYNSNFTQSQQQQAKVEAQIQNKRPKSKVSSKSYPQNPNESFKQIINKDQINQLSIPIPSTTVQQQHQKSPNITITQTQTQTLNNNSSSQSTSINNSLNNFSNKVISTTPTKQKIKHIDYNKYRHLSTIHERSEIADSFLSQLHENKSEIIIQQQQQSLIADKQRDYQSQRENIHNSSFVEQIKVWTITYPSGTKYIGEVKNNKRNGLGTFFYIDGSKYHGHWLDNKMNGFGTLYYPNGKIAYQGEWKMDNFHGKGKVYNDQIQYFSESYHYENCTDIDNYWLEYDGELIDDRKQGKGILKLANGQYFEGQFNNDQLNGYCKFHSKNHNIIEGIWENSKLVKIIAERMNQSSV